MNHETPAVPDHERAILGVILRNNEKAHEAFSELHAEDFFVQGNRLIFEALVEMLDLGSGLDARLLAEKLTTQGNLASAGGVAYVLSLTDGVLGNTNLGSYITSVKDCSRRRRVMNLCEMSIPALADRSIPYRQSTGQIEDGLLEVQADSGSSGPKHIFIGSDEHFNRLMEQSKDDGVRVGVSFGVRSLDTDTTGMRPTELWVLGGRPGEGKTSMLCQAILANAKEGTPVGFFSLEMSQDQVREKLWSLQSRIPFERIRNPSRLSTEEKRKLKTAVAEVANLPIYIDDDGGIDIGTLTARGRLMIARHGVKFIGVDYVQIVGAAAKDERQKVSKVSQGLRMLAKTQKVPILALSQMPRPKDSNLNRWPTKYDLKESGSLEADAVGIVMIFREVDSETSLPTGKDVLVIPKQRFGPATFENVMFLDTTLQYVERMG